MFFSQRPHDAAKFLLQYGASAMEPAFDGPLRRRTLARNFRDGLAFEIERFEDLAVRASNSRESPTDNRSSVGRISGESAGLEIERRRIDQLRLHSSEMADEDVPRHANQPGDRLVGNTSRRPSVEGAHPRFLHQVFGQPDVAANTTRDEGIEWTDRQPVGLNQIVLGQLPRHVPIDAEVGPDPTIFFRPSDWNRVRPAFGRGERYAGRMTTYTVGYLVGSLAKGSINRKLSRSLVRLAPAELVLKEVAFADLPIYNYDFDASFPPAAREFKDALGAVDGYLFVTPEYNRSIPGGLKNAIDWGSRPYGKNSFTRKPSAIIGTSPGKIGTAVGQQHLRSILAFCNSPLMNSIEAYIQFTPGLINDDGEITDQTVEEFLREYLVELYGFICRVYTVVPRRP